MNYGNSRNPGACTVNGHRLVVRGTKLCQKLCSKLYGEEGFSGRRCLDADHLRILRIVRNLKIDCIPVTVLHLEHPPAVIIGSIIDAYNVTFTDIYITELVRRNLQVGAPVCKVMVALPDEGFYVRSGNLKADCPGNGAAVIEVKHKTIHARAYTLRKHK